MKVLLADDHWSARAAIKLLLSETYEHAVFIETESFEEALRQAARHDDLRLVVCDLVMPGLGALGDLKRLLNQVPEVPIAIYSMVEDRNDVLTAIDLGVTGFIPKTMPGDGVKEALARIVAQEVYLPPTGLKSLPRRAFDANGYGTVDAAPRRAMDSLTGRQREVLACLARGAPNGAIARELGLSENTVRIHISAILRALELKNRTQAALLAAAHLQGAEARPSVPAQAPERVAAGAVGGNTKRR